MMERAHDPELKIAERYFLGELSDDEAEAFEAHYFECPRCAEYVVEELYMMESGREVARAVRETPANVVPLVPRARRQWIPAAVAAMLVLTVGAPMLLRGGPEPRVDSPNTIRITFSADRAAAAPARTAPKGVPVALEVDIPPADFPRFVVTIRDEAGEIVDKPHERTSEQTAEPVLLVLSELPAGTYNVVIEGVRENGSRSPVAPSQSFEVRGQSQGGRS
jgi:anti-sigma factor RsiW